MTNTARHPITILAALALLAAVCLLALSPSFRALEAPVLRGLLEGLTMFAAPLRI